MTHFRNRIIEMPYFNLLFAEVEKEIQEDPSGFKTRSSQHIDTQFDSLTRVRIINHSNLPFNLVFLV